MVKIITLDLLPYLNPISLAYWAIDDGSYKDGGFKFAINRFSFDEAYLLVAMLHYQFG